MLQFNLLPDVKIEYVKAKRMQRMVVGTAVVATVATVTITLLLFLVVYGVQKKHMSDLNKDIAKYSGQLKSTPDLDKILTIQNQMAALGPLHDQKIVTSRIFQLIQQTTPVSVSISDYETDFAANTIQISGSASALSRVNTYTDSLKFATFKTADGASVKPFSSVVLSAFGRGDDATSYTITLSFDPIIFSSSSSFDLVVPKQITTNSVTNQPSQIFNSNNSTDGTVRIDN